MEEFDGNYYYSADTRDMPHPVHRLRRRDGRVWILRIRLNTAADVALFLEKCAKYPQNITLFHYVTGKTLEIRAESEKLLARPGGVYDAYIFATHIDTIRQFRRDIALWEEPV